MFSDFAQTCAAALQEASSEAALREALQETATAFGLRFYALGPHGGLTPATRWAPLTNYPAAWVARYQTRGYVGFDPVVVACRTSARGFLWSELPTMLSLTDKQTALLAEAARFGLGEGFTTPIHVPGERPGACSFVAAAGDGIDPAALAFLPYLGSLAYEKARLLTDNAGGPVEEAALTARQRDCVVLVARGKSDWEAATILGLSHDTVHQHIEEAKRRFKAKTRLQLVILALAQGAISFADVIPWSFLVKKAK